jgi:serine/threonine protein kinase
MLATPCPSFEELRRYSLGECDEPAGRRIEEHLNRCSACEETLADFDSADDTLVRHLPLAASADPRSDAAWLDRLRRLPHGQFPDEMEFLKNDEQPGAGDFLGSYRLLACIGRGGMGVVYRAMHNQLDRVVALKVLSPHLVASAAARARFDREIQIVGKLEYPGIVRASDAGREGQVAYLVMEYIDGVDLSRLVRRGGPLNVPEACEAARQIAEALAAAHAIGAVHRDVKPSNVMIDRGGRAKLLDFGLAHLSAEVAADRETTLGRLLGTLDYLSPEQAEGEPLDHRADLYGLGATLFFLLTGRPPHGYSSDRPLLAQLRKIADHDPPPLASIRPEVPAELNDLVARLLARRADDRPASAAEVAAQLAEFTGGDLAARVAEVAPPERDLRNSSPEQISAAETSLAELLGAAPVQENPAKPLQDQSRSIGTRNGAIRRGRRILAGFAAAAVLFAAAWLGVVIILQTSKGTVRIESDVDDVRVELLADGEDVQVLQINQGQNETTLRAGHYRLRLSGGHDALEITPVEFTLRRGEKLVARIHFEKPPVEPEKPAAPEEEPIYQGEPRSVWQDRYDRERDPKAKTEAAQALVALAETRPIAEQVSLWLKVGPSTGTRADSADERLVLQVLNGSSGVSFLGSRQLLHISQTAWNELAPALAAHFAEDPEPGARFAAALLAVVASQAQQPGNEKGAAAAVEVLLQVPEDDYGRWLTSRLLGAKLAPTDSRASKWLQEVIEKISIPGGSQQLRLAAIDAWLVLAADDSNPPEQIVRALGVRFLLDPAETLQFFSSIAASSDEPGTVAGPYLAQPQWRDRLVKDERLPQVLQLWPEAAAGSIARLDAAPENDQAALTGTLFESIDAVLQVAPADVLPPLVKTEEALDRHLRVRFVMDEAAQRVVENQQETASAPNTDLLLLNYWRITGVIPDYVIHGQPADPVVRKQLEELQKWISGEPYVTRGETAPGRSLWTTAPYHTAEALLLNHSDSPYVRQVARNLGSGTHAAHQLTAALIVDECGESSVRDAHFANMLGFYNFLVALAARDTLDGLRVAEAAKAIILKTSDPKLLEAAIEIARNSKRLRDELGELLSQRTQNDLLVSAEEAVAYLRLVEGRWQTVPGRRAVRVLERSVEKGANLDLLQKSLSALAELEGYDPSAIAFQIKLMSELERNAIAARDGNEQDPKILDLFKRVDEVLKPLAPQEAEPRDE